MKSQARPAPHKRDHSKSPPTARQPRQIGSAFTPKSLFGYLLLLVAGAAIMSTIAHLVRPEKHNEQATNPVMVFPGETYVTKLTPEQAREMDAARLKEEAAGQKK